MTMSHLTVFRSIIPALLALSLAGCGYGVSLDLTPLSSSLAPERTQNVPIGSGSKPGHVYLVRGLVGDIFSLGMDDLAAKIQSRGVKASVYGFTEAGGVANDIIGKYKIDPSSAPVMLVGHSTGGDAIIAIAQRLKAAQIPVALAVTIDPTAAASGVPSNVDLLVNFYQGGNLIGGSAKPGDGFRGRLVNVDLRQRRELVHVTLDKSDVIHDRVLKKILGISEAAAKPDSSVLAGAASKRGTPFDGANTVARPGYVTPLVMRYVVPPGANIDVWDSAEQIVVGDETLQVISATHSAPAWAIAQINQLDADTPPRPGQSLLIPRSTQSPSLTAFSGR